MKITKENFMEKFNMVKKGAKSNYSVPTMECVKISSLRGVIKMETTNSNYALSVVVPGDAPEDENILVSASKLAQILPKLADDIEIRENDRYVAISDGINVIHLEKTSGDFNPLVAPEKAEKQYTVDADELKSCLTAVKHATLQADNAVMQSVKLEISDEGIRATGLDGHRVAVKYTSDKKGDEILIHNSVIEAVLGMEGKITVKIGANRSSFEADNIKMVMANIVGSFYKIDNILNADYPNKVSVVKDDLKKMADLAILACNSNATNPMRLSIEDKVVKMTCLGSTEISSKADVTEKVGDNVLIGFNPKFLSEALDIVDEDIVTLNYINASSPAMIRGDGYLEIVLPVRVQ